MSLLSTPPHFLDPSSAASAQVLSAINADLKRLMMKPACRVTAGGVPQTLPSGTVITKTASGVQVANLLVFSHVALDSSETADMWVVGTPSRLWIRTPGLWRVGAHIGWAVAGVAGFTQEVGIVKIPAVGSASFVALDNRQAPALTNPQGRNHAVHSAPIPALAGDSFVAYGWQDSGSTLDTDPSQVDVAFYAEFVLSVDP